MTDDRNEPWRQDPDESGQKAERDISVSGPHDASPQYSRRLDLQDKVVDRSLAELDNVIAELNRATSHWSRDTGSQSGSLPESAGMKVVDAGPAPMPGPKVVDPEPAPMPAPKVVAAGPAPMPAPKLVDPGPAPMPAPKLVDAEPAPMPAPKLVDAEPAPMPAPKLVDAEPAPMPAPKLVDAEPATMPAPKLVDAEPAPMPAPAIPEAPEHENVLEPEMRFAEAPKPATEMKTEGTKEGSIKIIEADTGPLKASPPPVPSPGGPDNGKNGGGGDDRRGGGGGGQGSGGKFHKRLGPINFAENLAAARRAVRWNLGIVMMFTVATNVLVLAIPVYLFQISDRVLTSRSIDTLVMLTVVIVGAVLLQSVLDAIRRFILMRTAVEVAVQLGAPILSAAARASLYSSGREYQTLGDLQQLRSFLVSGTLLSFFDAPMAPLFIVAVFLVHPDLGFIVVTAALVLILIAFLNQRATAGRFSEANAHQSKANLHLDSMSRNSQIINALAMIPEAVKIWGRDTAGSLTAQEFLAQDRNVVFASCSKAARLLTQIAMLGWGAALAIEGHLTGGMVIAASIIAGRALAPVEGAIEGWNQVVHSRASYGRIVALLQSSPLNFERLNLPRPEGRVDVERLLFVPQGTKRVVLNGITLSLSPGDSLAVIGNSGAGKTTLGKMLVGSILPTSGSVRLDLMDLRNWDQRQFGENIGYLPQDVQLFPGTIKANIARMRDDATDADIYQAAMLADVHEMIATLPQGYETFVAADGAPLSGGQKQRVALARAFFGNPKMVVLDEPNSNLDSTGDTALARALAHAKEHRITVITITQRPSLLRSVDKILLLTNGTVSMFGVRKDVLNALAARGIAPGGSIAAQ